MLEEYPDVLTVSDLQKILRIGRCTAYEIVNTPNFPCIRVGRAIRIPKIAFIRWLTNGQLIERKQADVNQH